MPTQFRNDPGRSESFQAVANIIELSGKAVNAAKLRSKKERMLSAGTLEEMQAIAAEPAEQSTGFLGRLGDTLGRGADPGFSPGVEALKQIGLPLAGAIETRDTARQKNVLAESRLAEDQFSAQGRVLQTLSRRADETGDPADKQAFDDYRDFLLQGKGLPEPKPKNQINAFGTGVQAHKPVINKEGNLTPIVYPVPKLPGVLMGQIEEIRESEGEVAADVHFDKHKGRFKITREESDELIREFKKTHTREETIRFVKRIISLIKKD